MTNYYNESYRRSRFHSSFLWFLNAIDMLREDRRLLLLSATPMVLNLIFFIGLYYLGSHFLDSYFFLILKPVLSFFRLGNVGILKSSFGWLSKALFLLFFLTFSGFIFSLLGTILCAPFSSAISHRSYLLTQKRLSKFGVQLPKLHQTSFFWSIVYEIRRFCVLLLSGLFCFLLGLIPSLQIIAFFCTGIILSFDYFGYGFEQQNISIRKSIFLVLKHFPTSLLFGCSTSLLLSIPFINALVVPLAIVEGTRLSYEKIILAQIKKDKDT